MRALIVDDNAELARLFSRYMSRHGWSSDESRSVSAAMGLFIGGRYDLVVCDIDLPDGDGIALARRLREIRPELPVVMVSGSPENLERARKAGFGRRLQKPFSLDKMRPLLARGRPETLKKLPVKKLKRAFGGSEGPQDENNGGTLLRQGR